jgi:hypothetical protein
MMRPHAALRFLVPVLALLVLSAPSAAGPPPDVAGQAAAHRHAWGTIQRRQAEAVRSRHRQRLRALRLAHRRGVDENPVAVVRTRVTFAADEAAGTIDTRTFVTLRATADDVRQAQFYLMRLADFGVTDEGGTPLDFTYEEAWGYGFVTVTVPRLDAGDEIVLGFRNAGRPQCDPDPYFGMSMCSVSPEVVFFAGADWVPVKAPSTSEDLAGGPVDVEITTPPGYVAVSTSDPAGVEDLGDRLTHRFAGHFSDQGIVGLAYAQFDTFAAPTADGKPVTAYIHTGPRDFGPDWAATCAAIVDYYSRIYAPYLYNKHDAIQAIEALGGGVGPASATFYVASALNQDPSTFSSESLFAHEIAHSWFAGMVRVSDPYSPWLSEGLAEYSSRLYGYEIWPASWQDYLYGYYFQLFRAFVPPAQEAPLTSADIFADDSMVYFFLTYIKGAHVMRMLEWLLGEEAFFAGMARYVAAHTWDLTHTAADVPALQAALEAASGRDLATFFRQWIYATGNPVLRWAAEFGENEQGYTVRVRVTQTQESDEVYDLPVEVSLWAGAALEPTTRRLVFDGRVADQTFVVDEPPFGVAVDYAARLWAEKIPELTGDADSSNEVDGVDLIMTAWAQGSSVAEGSLNYLASADFNRDGTIDEADLALLQGNFAAKGAIHE